MKIPIINPTTTLTEKTWLTAKYTSGTSLAVKDSTGFADDDLILIGEVGQERTETTDLTATPPSKVALTVTALDFAHGKDTPIYKLLFDQAEIYRSTDAGVSYTLLTTVNLTYDKMMTIYEDLTGASTYYYKVKLKNSVTANTSDFSGAQVGSGWPRKSVGRMIRNVRRNLGDLKNKTIEDWEIMEALKNASDDILAEIPHAYWTLKIATKTTTADQYDDYDLPARYRSMLFLMYQHNPTSSDDRTYPLDYKPLDVFLRNHSDNNETSDDWLDQWTELPGDNDFPNGYFGVYPTPASSAKNFTLYYFESENEFDNYADVTNCPLPQVLEHHATSALAKDTDTVGRYNALYLRGINHLRVMQRRNFQPKTLIRWEGRDGVSKLYGRGAVRRTQEDIENRW